MVLSMTIEQATSEIEIFSLLGAGLIVRTVIFFFLEA